MNETSLDIIKEIEDEIKEIPLGNSSFQNKYLTDGHESKSRRKRVVLLQLRDRLDKLQHAKFSRDRLKIDIEELNKNITTLIIDSFERRRLLIDLEEKEYHLNHQEKLIIDAMVEVDDFYKEMKSLPKFSREEFESNELGYWKDRLLNDAQRQLKCSGSINPEIVKEINKLNLNILVQQNGNIILVDQKKQLEDKV